MNFKATVLLHYLFDMKGYSLYILMGLRRGDREAEGAGLENRFGVYVNEGSNPSLSVKVTGIKMPVAFFR